MERLVAPAMSAMLARGMLRRSARKAMRASFHPSDPTGSLGTPTLAWPSVGGVVSEILRASAWVPVMALRLAPGWTRTERVQPSGVGRIMK